MALGLILLTVGATAFIMRHLSYVGKGEPSQMASKTGGQKESPVLRVNPAAVRGPTRPAPEPSTVSIRIPVGRVSHDGVAQARTPIKRKLTPQELVRRAEQNYRDAIALLERDLKRRPAPLDPKVRVQFDLALASIDLTIKETRQAVRRQPDDPTLVQYMLTAYAKKVEVLEEMVSN
jgi:hypothetical protein